MAVVAGGRSGRESSASWRVGAAVLALAVVLATGLAVAGYSGTGFGDLALDVQGGFAGFATHLAVSGEGKWVLTERGDPVAEGSLEPSVQKELSRLADGIEWNKLDAEYLVEPPVVDDITYIVTVDGTKVTVSSMATMPGDLASLLAYLNNLLAGMRAGQ